MANNQSVRRHLDAFTRGRIIGKLEEGRSVTSVAAEFGIAHSIISRLWRQFQTTGTAIRGFSSGRPRGTTPADDRYIVLQARRNRRQTAGEIARHTTQATGRPISRFTVARRLHGGGLFARRPVRYVPLMPAHRRRRSLWCREHRNLGHNEWGRVLFTDESRFSLSSDSHRILIWRERGSRNHPSNIIERDRYGGRGVLVWGGIMLGSRTDFHIFDAGSVNGTRYCNEILLPYVRLFRGAMGLQFLFMDDNAPCHRTVTSEQLLESEDIERMDWLARSPDLNPIEHVWDFLGRRLTARTLSPVTIRELRLALQDEWAAMPQQLIDTLILSMSRRCETCLAVSGEIISPTKDRMFLAGHPSQGCFGLQSHCAPCYFFNQASFYPSDFSFKDFNYEIIHHPGKQMGHADCLSRYPVMTITYDKITTKLENYQRNDEYISSLKTLLENKKIKDFVVKNDVLHKIENDNNVLVVPQQMQTEIVKNIHCKGHLGINKTESMIKQSFYFPNIKKCVENVINNFIEYILVNKKRGKDEGLLNPIPKENIPLSTYHIDFLGPLPSTNKNYNHILSVIDAFTKFAWLYPVKSTSSRDALEKVKQQEITYGNPRRIITDKGIAFTSKEFREYCENENIQHLSITTGIT
ncbi:transposable element Tcb2 transposase [Trichonephila clavipes]|nr:transposable element Tcb2 transposase [Trichonephila clavipes]